MAEPVAADTGAESEPGGAIADAAAPEAEAGAERDGRRRGGRGRQRREPREAGVMADEVVAESAVARTELEPVPAALASEPQAAVAAVADSESEAEPLATPMVEATVAAAPALTPAPAPQTAPALAATPAAKAAEPFVLNAEQLNAVAEASGLQWVGSDRAKILAAQEAMAREPKPAHVPREAKPVAAVDTGPLVLVETRKDLSQFKLPFETSPN